jgi:hypothetical protein
LHILVEQLAGIGAERKREETERERERERVREREETERERREKEERERRGGEERDRVETCNCVRFQCLNCITKLIVFSLSNRPRPDFFRYLRHHTSAYMPNSFIYLCVYMNVSK